MFNLKEVPEGSPLIKLRGKYYTLLDGKLNQIFYSPVSKAVVNEVPDLTVENAVVLDATRALSPNAGITSKYLSMKPVPHLPKALWDGPLIQEAPGSVTLPLQPLESLEPDNFKISSVQIRWSDLDPNDPFLNISGSGLLKYYTTQATDGDNIPIAAGVIPIFVFCGRGQNAQILYDEEVKNSSKTCVILVGTREEYQKLKQFLCPGINFLAIYKLTSKSHGNFADCLGSINTRRLVAFLFAMCLQRWNGVEHAIMMDDNLKSVRFPSAGVENPTWIDFVLQMKIALHQSNAVCASIATQSSRGLREEQPGELGSKLFMYNLKEIYDKLNLDKSLWFLLALPSSASKFWGEDYYLQLILSAIFSDSFLGYCVLSSSKFGLTRTNQASLCVHTVKKANIWVEYYFTEIFKTMFPNGLDELNKINPAATIWVQTAISQLREIVAENIRIQEERMKRFEAASLMNEHANANQIAPYTPELNVIPILDEDFLSRLKSQIILILELFFLFGYQKEILYFMSEKIINTDAHGNIIFNVEMATGTGKSYIMAALVFAALLAKNPRPIIIITPYQQLVQQLFEDFIGLLRENPQLGIQEAQILKIDGRSSSISVQALAQNNTLKTGLRYGAGFVAIFCSDSYKAVLNLGQEFPNLEFFKNPSMVMLDESHLQQDVAIELSRQNLNNCFVAGLSATPSEQPSILSFPNSVKISYSRSQAVLDGNLAPCILDIIDLPYSHDNVMLLINNLPILMRSILLPSGEVLGSMKGIFYVPNDNGPFSYSMKVQQVLTESGIECVEINSGLADAEETLRRFRATGHIAICKGMLKEGYSDKKVNWVWDMRNNNAADVAQSAGRCMRRDRENPEKIAYLLGFRGIKSALLFPDGEPTADDAALEVCADEYKRQRAATQGYAFRINQPTEGLSIFDRKRKRKRQPQPQDIDEGQDRASKIFK